MKNEPIFPSDSWCEAYRNGACGAYCIAYVGVYPDGRTGAIYTAYQRARQQYDKAITNRIIYLVRIKFKRGALS